MSIVSFDELATYMGGGDHLTPNQKRIVSDVVIPGVQQQLETYLNTTLELVQVRESLAPEMGGFIYFTYAPVRKLISAIWSSEGSVPLVLSQYVPDAVAVDPSVNRPVIDRTAPATSDLSYRYQVGLTGFPALLGGGQTPYMVVDYIAGTDQSNNAGLKLDIMRVCAREVDRVFDPSAAVRNGSLEPITESDVRLKGWTKEELQAWNRLKRRVIL